MIHPADGEARRAAPPVETAGAAPVVDEGDAVGEVAAGTEVDVAVDVAVPDTLLVVLLVAPPVAALVLLAVLVGPNVLVHVPLFFPPSSPVTRSSFCFTKSSATSV